MGVAAGVAAGVAVGVHGGDTQMPVTVAGQVQSVLFAAGALPGCSSPALPTPYPCR